MSYKTVIIEGLISQALTNRNHVLFMERVRKEGSSRIETQTLRTLSQRFL